MTREEYKKHIKETIKFINEGILDEFFDVLIDEIFNDFENRKCMDCRDFCDGECRIFAGAVVKDTTGRVSKEDFYCKYFEE